MNRRHLSVWVSFLLSSPLYAAAPIERPQSLDIRVTELERQLQLRSGLQADMQMKYDALQQEVQQLRGMVEEQGYLLKQATDRQKTLYSDLDQRLSKLKSGSTPVVPVVPAETDTPDATSTDDINANDSPAADESELAMYNKAFELLKAKQYPQAIKAYQNFFVSYPDSSYTANSRYWLGSLYFLQQDYDKAMAEFAIVTQHYPSSDKAAEAYLKQGIIFAQWKQNDKAKLCWQNVIKLYPQSAAAKQAQQRLKSL